MHQLSPQERKIMQTIWTAGDDYLTAREIQAAMLAEEGKELNISPLMITLAKMAEKGFLNPVKKLRKPMYYEPLVTEQEYKVFVTKQFVDGIHNGDFASLILSLVDNDQYTKNDVDQMRRLLERLSDQK